MENGTYAVIITENSCSDTSACLVVNSVGVENTFSFAIEIYPNPAEEIVTVDMGANTQVVRVRLINVHGQILHDQQYSSGSSIDLSLSHLANGMYAVRISSESSVFQEKVVKR